MFHIKQIKMKYVIITSQEVANVNFDKVLETSENTLRYSLDKTQALLKFDGETPSFLEGKEIHNYSEIMNILNSPKWAEQD